VVGGHHPSGTPLNRRDGCGVLWGEAQMHEHAERLAGSVVTLDEDLEREFEARLVESATLAFRVAFGVLRQREDAEDVAQEAFAKAYRSFRQLRDRARFRAWLVRMAWRLALDRQRSDRRRAARELQAEPSASVVESFDARERADQLWRAIDALPEKLRVTIVLSGIHGHDVREVAALLELPEGTVKSRLFLARQQLKERLSWMNEHR
jgi:RNA polymerase sigma-70 factor (ECF subfamily)